MDPSAATQGRAPLGTQLGGFFRGEEKSETETSKARTRLNVIEVETIGSCWDESKLCVQERDNHRRLELSKRRLGLGMFVLAAQV